ncbi:MAG: hypothetical protein KIT48_05490 [Pseudolabrys sp.]|nr:hypothetical protein [Pseudolabrys sp.]
MQHRTDIVQSFWLRFWREPHRGAHREWRGSIWHEQQAAHDKPTIVANPEEAFEFVRRVLHGQVQDSDDGSAVPRASLPSNERHDDGIPGLLRRLTAFWRRQRGEKP